jgi:hypothetical protein
VDGGNSTGDRCSFGKDDPKCIDLDGLSDMQRIELASHSPSPRTITMRTHQFPGREHAIFRCAEVPAPSETGTRAANFLNASFFTAVHQGPQAMKEMSEILARRRFRKSKNSHPAKSQVEWSKNSFQQAKSLPQTNLHRRAKSPCTRMGRGRKKKVKNLAGDAVLLYNFEGGEAEQSAAERRIPIGLRRFLELGDSTLSDSCLEVAG